MDPKPFIELKKSRRVEVDWLPGELRAFYAIREGVGLGSPSQRIVRTCELAEIERIAWAHLDWLPIGEDTARAWKGFSAIRFGVSSFGDDIAYVISAPSASPGSIMTFGFDVAGPGGTGDHVFEGSLVLSEDFDRWIIRLAKDDWCEYGLVPGSINELPAARQKELRSHFKRLNPRITWGDTE